MNILIFLELFCLISTNLSDKKKIFLISCSKIIYNFKLLLILDSEYDLEEVNNKWYMTCAKNIFIKKSSLEDEINELIKNLIPESITVHSEYIKFISNNKNIKLVNNVIMIKKIISAHGNYCLATKIEFCIDENICRPIGIFPDL